MSRLRKRAAVAALAAVLLVGGGAAVAAPAAGEAGGPEPTAWERVWSGIRGLLGLDAPRSEASAQREPKPERWVTPPAAPSEGGETDAGGSLDPDG